MNATTSRLLMWSVLSAVLITLLVFLFWPRPLVVEIRELNTSTFRQTITEDGTTRVQDIYVLSAPVSGYLRRIQADVGDDVIESTTLLAELEPIDPSLLDPRSEAQAKADVEAAHSSLMLAQAEVNQAEAELEYASSELRRIQALRQSNSVSERELDNAQRTFKTRQAALATAVAAIQMRTFELERMKAQLMSPVTTIALHGNCKCLEITAPITGKVLRLRQESEGVVIAGTPLIELGDPRKLEVVVELLSFDAVKVKPGLPVEVTNWGGEQPLAGEVKTVEPIGFEKVSALGIEEQRVNVIVRLLDPPDFWSRLGHGYQLDVEIILWQAENVLAIPITALFRDGKEWAVFVATDNKVSKRHLTLGRRNAYFARVLSGIEAGELFIAYPNNQLEEGSKVVSAHQIAK